MLEDLWARFKEAGYCGSVSVKEVLGKSEHDSFAIKSDFDDDDSFIHEAIYNMDPDYTAICVVKSGYKGETSGLPVVSFGAEGSLSKEDIADALDNAVLEGLGHQKALIIKESGAVVRFGYSDFKVI